jgi:hypothetical protein
MIGQAIIQGLRVARPHGPQFGGVGTSPRSHEGHCYSRTEFRQEPAGLARLAPARFLIATASATLDAIWLIG